MADTAVRVDIIVGQNTVVPSVERTQSALAGVSTVAARTNTGFDNLSKGGLKRLESGFQALAFQAAGVPGPLGRIASGALLLGGGSGLLLGVAAAAGAVALAWQALTKHSRELAKAVKELQDLLPGNDAGAEKQAKLWKEYGDMMRRASELEAKANRPGAMFAASSLRADAAALREKAAALKQMLDAVALTVPSMGGTGKPGGGGGSGKDPNAFWQMVTNGIALQPSIAAAGESSIALRDAIVNPLEEMPERVGQAFVDMNEEFIKGLEITQDLIDGINATLFYGFVDMAANVAAALGNGDSVGDVILAALGQMMQDIGRMMITAGIALTNLIPALTNFLTSGPAMIAAGVILSAVGAAASKRAQGGGVHGGAATGGVNSGRYERDQQEMGARGTVTIQMGRDGFIRPSDPVFQEFLAQVIKEAKGRNVVFA